MADNCSVKVAIRIRPLVPSETSKGCREIVDVVEENDQIIMRSLDRDDKAFTFNYVLSSGASQSEMYSRCVQPLIPNLFKGYNVTILAYGQTGSGKTYSMGTSYNGENDTGVIPRAVSEIFDHVRDNFSYDFIITVSFMELYQEVLYDLLSGKPREQCILEIREDSSKGIHIPRLTEVPVTSANAVLEALQKGSLGRATGATAMNMHSSRSHAIFSINISMTNKADCKENKQAKLHLVDLAGSERPKKTGATGNTFKEGVNINKGLLALGNVISALGDEKQQNGFIPYRDSSLTRLLKDSLGGNSITLMIACVSPADYNIDETLSTLRYADRARKIKNKPIVNQDAKVAEINDLKKTIQQLRLQILGQGGPAICPAEIELLKKEIVDLKLKIRDLTTQLSRALVEKTSLHEKLLILQTSNEVLNQKLQDIKAEYDITFNNITFAIENNNVAQLKDHLHKFQNIQKQFAELSDEQKKADEEIREHEDSFNKMLMNSDSEASCEIDEKHEIHTTRQMDLNTQLINVQKELVLKEGLAKQLIVNNQYMVDYEAMAENEAKIANLQKEKEELLQMVKKLGTTDKLTDQRKKRIQELEKQLTDLNKKVQEQARLIKMKAKDEERISKLNQDILLMKQTKVKLVRAMKDESDKFRQWKLQKERECLRLKQQDLKKNNEITKMKAMQVKQQIVFKRRVEQAEALNKRLKGLLSVRQQIQDTKNSGTAEKIEPWLKQDYEVYINVVEAEAALKELLDDRATLRQQLDEMKANPDTATSEECKVIEDDLELRSLQIQDLQQKIIDSSDDNKSKTRYDRLQTMGEAKFAVKFLYSKIGDVHRERVQLMSKLNDQQESLTEIHNKLKASDEKTKQLEEEHSKSLVTMQHEYEEKIAILLRQLRNISDGADKTKEYKEMFNIQQERIEHQEVKIRTLKAEKLALEEYKQKVEQQETKMKELENQKLELEERLQLIEVSKEHKENFPTPIVTVRQKTKESGNNTYTKPLKLLDETFIENINSVEDTSKKQRKPSEGDMFADESPVITVKGEAVDSFNHEDFDDIENDPDWRKTPLGKRILLEKKKMNLTKTALTFAGDGPVKRSSDGGCTCKTDCTKGRCGCKKMTKNCSASCRCNPEVCLNRNEIAIRDSEESSEDSDNFKRPRINQAPVKKNGKARRLYKLQDNVVE